MVRHCISFKIKSVRERKKVLQIKKMSWESFQYYFAYYVIKYNVFISIYIYIYNLYFIKKQRKKTKQQHQQ